MAEVEYGGLKVGGSKLLLIIPLLSMLGGGSWAAFELFNEFRVLKATVMEYQPPDITGIEQNIAVIEETLVGVGESVEQAKDYTRSIKNDLKDDLARQEALMERLEDKVNASQDEIDETIDVAGERFDARRDALYSDTDRKIKELEERLNSKLQRALDNPLAN
jgi:exonuclease VII large subunit